MTRSRHGEAGSGRMLRAVEVTLLVGTLGGYRFAGAICAVC
jgi:hypothetical protein